MDYVREQLAAFPPPLYADVLEVGSYNVNGSVRELLPHVHRYVGMDRREGPGVDLVANIETWDPDAPSHGYFHLVVSTEMLEHTERPWLAVDNMARALRPGGRLILTTRGPGFGLHEHPGDFYRFTPDALGVLCWDAGLRECLVSWDPDPGSPGAFVTAVRPDD